MMDLGRTRILHRSRYPSCERGTLSVSVDYVHNFGFLIVRVSVLGSSPPNQV